MSSAVNRLIEDMKADPLSYTIDDHTVFSERKRVCIWISNGLFFYNSYNAAYKAGSSQIFIPFTFWDKIRFFFFYNRWASWRAAKQMTEQWGDPPLRIVKDGVKK